MLWFHLSASTAAIRFAEEAPRQLPGLEIPDNEEEFNARYSEFNANSERAIRQTDTNDSPWHLIEAEDDNYRDLTAGQVLQVALEKRLKNSARKKNNANKPVRIEDTGQPTILDTVDTQAELPPEDYKQQLTEYQSRLNDLAWRARARRYSADLLR